MVPYAERDNIEIAGSVGIPISDFITVNAKDRWTRSNALTITTTGGDAYAWFGGPGYNQSMYLPERGADNKTITPVSQRS